RYGFWSVTITALCPPPVPIAPTLLVAGALKYPRQKFLAALTLGRAPRYFLVAYLGQRYGKHIIGWLTRYYRPLLYTLIALAVVGGLVGLFYWLRYKHQHGRGKQP